MKRSGLRRAYLSTVQKQPARTALQERINPLCFMTACYASFIIYFTIIHKIIVILLAYYNYSYYICKVIQKQMI